MPKQKRLRRAKAALIRALELTEKLLDGFPIPGAKGTIGTVLEIIKEAEVCAKVQRCFLSSLISLQRMATNTELCYNLRVHLLKLNDGLLRPLVGKTEDDVPKDALTAVEEYIQCVGFVSFGNRYLIDDYRCIGHGIEQLSQPKLDKDGVLSRWIHSKGMEDDIRNLMKNIEQNTRSYIVSLPRNGERFGCLLV